MSSIGTRTIALIGAPTDVGAGDRGASMGPEAMRVAGLVEALRERGLQVVDRGNLVGPSNPWQPPTNGYRHLDEVVVWNRLVMGAMYDELEAGHLPILLGGDHCVVDFDALSAEQASHRLGRLRIERRGLFHHGLKHPAERSRNPGRSRRSRRS